ncbi:MAG: APC family permease, partial [Victivallales bacterium]|nr:APC family permease [Victivallales bacterium]
MRRYLSPISVWALSFGCAVGWGAFVMPGTTFLPIAGPLGTAIGMVVGGIIMFLIGANYHYLIRRVPDAGGTYSFVKNELGYDHGLVGAWFLMLVYIAIIWANATALPIIFRHFLGDFFKIGPHYTIAGFDIYAGEIGLSFMAILISGLICMRGGRLASRTQTVMAIVLILGISSGFIAAVARNGFSVLNAQPYYYPGKNALAAVFNIVALTPWAFVGFESISHSAGEFTFSTRKVIVVLLLSVLCTIFAYVALNYIAIAAIPISYDNWVAYINDLGKFTGIDGLPTFHSVHVLLGTFGIVMLGCTVIAGVVTGLLGNYIAASRMLFSMTNDDLLPKWFGKVNAKRTPYNAVFFIMLLSLPIPFFGRTAIGWIVDVSTIGATIAYLYTSVVAFNIARKNGNLTIQVTGIIGSIVSILFFLYFMIPNFWTVSALTTESYL